MAVRAILRCDSVIAARWGAPDDQQVTLSPIADKDGIYKEYSEATPSGCVQLVISNPEATSQFRQGALYSVVFEEV